MQAPTDLLAWMLARATESELRYALIGLAMERDREPFERLERLVAETRAVRENEDRRVREFDEREAKRARDILQRQMEGEA